jgi:hypothetical protein
MTYHTKKVLLIFPFAIPLLLMFILSCTPGISFSEDLGRHLLLGRIIIENSCVPKTNFLTYTYPNFPFINHHWLSQVVLYLLHNRIGLNGLIIIKMVSMTATLGIAMFAVKTKRHQWLIWLTSIMSAIILAYRAHIRPELFSYLAIALFLLIFERYRKGNKKIRWLLLPIILLWSNAHIYFIFGIGMLGAFAIENCLLKRDKKTIINEIKWLLALIMVSIINPNGIYGFLYPFRIFNNYGVNITENISPLALWQTVLNPMLLVLPTISLLAISAICYELWNLRKHRKEKTLLSIRLANIIIVIAAIIAAWTMARSTPLLAICVLPLIAASANQLPDFHIKNPIINRSIPVCIYGLLTILSLFLMTIIINGKFYRIFPSPIGPTPFGFDKNPQRWDTLSKLKSKINKHNCIKNRNIKSENYAQNTQKDIPNKYAVVHTANTGQVFSDYNIGSLVEYQLYPQKGYVDNRPEAFPAEFWENEYYPALSLGAKWHEISRKREIELIIVSLYGVHPSFIHELNARQQWSLIHLDENCAVWIRNTEKNKKIIQQLEFNQNRLDLYEKNIAERLLKLPDISWWNRQIEADILVFRLYSLICIGENQRAWPYIWQLHQLYPEYQAIHELMRVTAPPDKISAIEPIFQSKAHWPLSAKQVTDWANHLQAQGKTKQAIQTISRGRIFFPLSPELKKMKRELIKDVKKKKVYINGIY